MTWNDFRNLEFREAGEWPALAKAIVFVLLSALMAGAWYYYDVQHLYAEHARVKATETQLKATFEEKQSRVVNLELYREQLEDMRQTLGAMLRQLPDKAEIAGLLVDVSQSGLASGLEFELFQPEGELTQSFYAEKPIRIRVVGSYHEFGEFISSIASMPRIVTVHDIRIVPRQAGLLQMDAVAKTYRYLDEAEGGGS